MFLFRGNRVTSLVVGFGHLEGCNHLKACEHGSSSAWWWRHQHSQASGLHSKHTLYI